MSAQSCHDAAGQFIYTNDPVLLLFGDEGEKLAAARDAAERAGCRIASEGSIAEASERLDRQVLAHAAVVIADQPSDALDALLERLHAEAERERLRSVFVIPPHLIDVATARGFSPGIEYLVEATLQELELAIAAASVRTPQQLHDISRDGAGVLQQLSEEAARIASVLASLSEEEEGTQQREGGPRELDEAPPIDAGLVRSIIRARRLRDHYFRGGMFADPAFDMLLDLYAARLEGSRVAVSSLCIAAAVPATTALRWIKALTDRGLFVRAADPQDGRRVYIELSDESARAMGHYLAAVQRAGLPAV